MADLPNEFQSFMSQVKHLIPNATEQSKITEAGAKVFAEKLKKATPVSKLHHSKEKHLKDYVAYQAKDIDNTLDGSSVVGFGKKAYIARFQNDGTKKMAATHFVDNTRRDSLPEIFKAQKEVYDSMLLRRHK